MTTGSIVVQTGVTGTAITFFSDTILDADDPIAYVPPMEIFNGKYYMQGGVKYLCTRDSGTALSHDLSALVGLYVTTA